MCGRFSFSTTKEKLRQQLGDIDVDAPLEVHWNIAPTQSAYVITNEEPHRLNSFTWGLLPYWSKEGTVTGRLINARREGIAEKPSFRTPFRRRRCWVLADSFYEWRRAGKEKIPYRIHTTDGELLVMAGIWDRWGHGEEAIRTFSIITTTPNREVAFLHDRMPALLLTAHQRERWLLSDDVDELLQLLDTPPDGCLDYYRVSQALNSPRNDNAALHDPVEDDWKRE